MLGDPSRSTVPIETPARKDITMKLLCILAAFLAITLGEDVDQKEIKDLEAVATVELLKTKPLTDALETAESSYNYYPNQNNKYVEPKNSVPYYPPGPANNNYQQSYYPNQNTYYPNQNNNYPQNNYVPQNPVNRPQNDYVPPQNTYVPPQNTYVPPQNTYVPPQNTYVPPQNTYFPPQNNYNPPNNNWKPQAPTTTTPSSVIKNEINFGDNGSYNYEYQIKDGTHASEEGYLLYPGTEHESLVKRGWYSYTGPDGKVYTVTYWADHTGFHPSGDHLPTPPPIPPAIQASIDAQAEAEKNKPQQPVTQKPQTGYYPTQAPYPTQHPYPSQPTYTPQPTYPTQPVYYPPQQTYYPQKPSYGK